MRHYKNATYSHLTASLSCDAVLSLFSVSESLSFTHIRTQSIQMLSWCSLCFIYMLIKYMTIMMISFAACFHSLKGGEVILMATWVNKVGLNILTRSMRPINHLCDALVSKHTDRREEKKRAYSSVQTICVVVNIRGLIHIGGVITPVSSCL